MYYCHRCRVHFQTSAALVRHDSSHHPECNFCEKELAIKDNIHGVCDECREPKKETDHIPEPSKTVKVKAFLDDYFNHAKDDAPLLKPELKELLETILELILDPDAN